jgi:carboxyl-terminal processing protease
MPQRKLSKNMKRFLSRRSILFISAVVVIFSSFKAADDYFEITKNLDIFASVYKEVNTSYVDDVKPGELMRAAIDAMLKTLDPYTNFYSEAQSEDYRFQITGSYGGIGASIRQRGDYIIIDSPYEGFPAQKADIRAGDKILEVDGKSVKGKTSSELTNLLKGTAGTKVTLLIDRNGAGKLEKSFERANIKLKNVPYYGMINEQTGYIKLTGFTPNAGKEVHDALTELKRNAGLSSVIFDLRGNGGGLLHEAVNIVNVFVKKGQLVVTTKGKEPENDATYKTLNAPVDTEMPLIVLIDGGSASASEIVSGSIQDLDRGIVIGQKSFGKGLVQSSRPLTYNTQMKITTAKYYIPSGRCIQRLDYGKKVNGKALSIADSLKKIFYTQNKRAVIDGEGVSPDIAIERPKNSKISQSLLSKYLIFDYATEYRNKHENIVSSKQFAFSERDFMDFMAFLKDKDYQYNTETESAVEELIKRAKEENYYQGIQTELDHLSMELKSDKSSDLTRYKDEIIEILETEIARRYYFDTAEIETTFDDDPDIREALKLFSDKTKYYSLLQPK